MKIKRIIIIFLEIEGRCIRRSRIRVTGRKLIEKAPILKRLDKEIVWIFFRICFRNEVCRSMEERLIDKSCWT